MRGGRACFDPMQVIQLTIKQFFNEGIELHAAPETNVERATELVKADVINRENLLNR